MNCPIVIIIILINYSPHYETFRYSIYKQIRRWLVQFCIHSFALLTCLSWIKIISGVLASHEVFILLQEDSLCQKHASVFMAIASIWGSGAAVHRLLKEFLVMGIKGIFINHNCAIPKSNLRGHNGWFSGPVGHRNKILRTIKDIRKQELEEDFPDEFLCPITREVMSDPVIAAGKHNSLLLLHN